LIGTPLGEALLYREDGLFLPSNPNQVTFDIADNQLDPADDIPPSVKTCESGHSTGSRSTGVSPVSWQGNSMPTSETPEVLESTNPGARWYNFTVIWGQVDRRIDVIDADAVLRGGGLITAPLSDSSQPGVFQADWEAQFATWEIPEPSSALLALIGSLGLLRRRR
jgi:hypothetical protein